MAREVRRNRTTSFRPDTSSVEGLVRIAGQSGLDKEARKIVEEPKLSLLQRLGRAFTTFETGNAVYQSRYENRSFIKTFAGDVAKDLGAAITGRENRLTPKKTYKDILVREGLKDRPGKLDAVDALGLAANIVGDPLTFFGGIVGRGVSKGLGLATKATKKIPVVGGAIAGIEEGVKGLFQPFSKIKALGQVGDEYIDSFSKFVKGTRAQQNDFFDAVTKQARGVKKLGIKDAGERITVGLEKRVSTGHKLLDDIVGFMQKKNKEIAKLEKSKGLLQTELPDYVHHMLTPEAAAHVKGGFDLVGLMKPIRPKLGAAKGRKLIGTVKEINDEYMKKYGFKLFEEDAFKAMAKRGLDSIKAVNTYDFLERTKFQFGKVAEKPFIDEFYVKWVQSTAKQLKGHVFPEPVAKHIDELNNFLTNDEATNSFLRMFDKVQNFWKGSVTGYFPAFHTRNALGGAFNNWIAGLNNPLFYKYADDIVRGKKGTIKIAGKQASNESLLRLAKEHGILGQSGILDLGDYLRREVDPTNIEKINKIPTQVMGSIEDRLRLPLFLDGLNKGMDPADAARRVLKYHFDYMPEGFTAFEKNVMKRVIPFYTWTRHNIPLQIEQMVMQPGKYSGVFKTQRAWGAKPSSEEEELLPKWLKERFTIKGEGGYWSGLGLPLEEATEKLSAPLRGFGISLSPLIKTPIEKLTGYNIFKEKRIEEDTSGYVYRNAPQPIKDFLEVKENNGYITVNPQRRYWFELVGSRGLSTAMRVANYTEDRKNLLVLLTTIRKYEYDLETLRKWSDADKRQELEKLLIEAGAIAEFKKTFVPK